LESGDGDGRLSFRVSHSRLITLLVKSQEVGLLITTETMDAELPKKQSLAMSAGPGGSMDF
jgi:hypothetical protein